MFFRRFICCTLSTSIHPSKNLEVAQTEFWFEYASTWWTKGGSKRKLPNHVAVLNAVQYLRDQEFPVGDPDQSLRQKVDTTPAISIASTIRALRFCTLVKKTEQQRGWTRRVHTQPLASNVSQNPGSDRFGGPIWLQFPGSL